MVTTHRVGAGRRHSQPVDETALRELDLYAENTGEIYPQKQAIIANLMKKKAKGKYDPARRYQKDFNRATKDALAAQLAKRYENGEDI